LWLAIPTDRYDSTKRQLLLNDIERRMARIPGVVSVGAIDNVMLNPLSQQGKRINVPGVTPPKGQTAFDIDCAAVDSGFFGAAGVAVVRGRGITAADIPTSPRVAVVNEEMARRFWPDKEAVGQSFRTDSVIYQVVGITRTTKVRSLGEDPRPFFMTSFAQEFAPTAFLVARTNGDAEHVTAQMLAGPARGGSRRDGDSGENDGATFRRHAASRPARGNGVHAVRRTGPRARLYSAYTAWSAMRWPDERVRSESVSLLARSRARL
jgi:hypothetical protein